ncbi:MAG: hypothetical protein ACI4AH_05870 [Muribaculaceae bacterium]
MKLSKIFIGIFLMVVAALAVCSCSTNKNVRLSTNYLGVDINDKGYIVGIWNTTRGDSRNFSPADRPSPLLSLYDEEARRYYYPQSASYDKANGIYELTYSNGSVAKVKVTPTEKYIKMQLNSLEPRNGIDDVQWGKFYTNIDNLLGDIIGVARDTSASVCYAIGVMPLDDNTIGGESHFTSETGTGGYIAHSPDHDKFPLPLTFHEGQQFTLGGDGYNDVAFYNRKDPYYRIIYGNAASVDDNGRIDIRFHSRDRRKGKMIYSPEGVPTFVNNESNHLMRQDVPGVDFIGSKIALWGSPDSIALMDVIQNIVKTEGLPYPTFQGKWVKDPTCFMPDVQTYGNCYDSIASYVKQMGLKVVHAYDHPFLNPDRGNGGFIDGRGANGKKPYHFTTGDLSHIEYANLLAKDGLILGRTTITNSMAPGTIDCSPFPSDSACIQHRRHLVADISPADTLIYIDDATYLNEIACWEGHCPELNMVKIGKELIHYLGVSKEAPYRLLNVTRGYWNTNKASHKAGENVDKMQVTVGWGYQGLVPGLELQDKIGEHYADIAKNSGLRMFDLDGQEFLFHSGFGAYSVKRFFRSVFETTKKYDLPDLRFTGATLSEGSWHYQSVWNVGGGKNMYDADTREWGSTTSQGKDLRDVTFANFFPSSFGVNFPITEKSTVEQYEHIEATAVGYGATYMLKVSQNDVEKCKDKYAIFNVIRTWEEARRAGAFPTHIRKLLQNPALSWRLESNADHSGWTLYRMENGNKVQSFNIYPSI